jgi:hypothetical protein
MAIMRPSKDILLVSVLLGIITTYFASWLPDITVVGIEGSRISSVVSLSALNGMIFGPILGPMVSFSGVLLHGLSNPNFFQKDIFHLISPLFTVFSSLTGALLISGRKKLALTLYAIPLLAWYAFPTGRTVFYYPWYHVFVWPYFQFDNKYTRKINTSKVILFIYLYLIASIAVLADHIAGSTSALIFYDLTPAMFNEVILAYPIERSILALFSTLIVFVLFLMFHTILQDITTFEGKAREIKEDTIEEYMQTEIKKILGK